MIHPLLLLTAMCAVAAFSQAAMAADVAPLTFDATKIGKPNSGAQAELWRPEGAGPFPAMVVLPACDGVDDNARSWAGRLRGWGYVAFLVDSFSPRNVRSVCYGGGNPTMSLRTQDAFNAAIYLRTLPDVLPESIGVIGFSHGGGAVLDATLTRKIPVDRGGRPFAAGVAYYPPCGPNPQIVAPATDLLILIGKDDDWALAANCEKNVAARAGLPHAPQIKVYPGAVHVFDGRGVPHLVVDHVIGGNAEAAADSFAMTEAFLGARLKSR